MTSAPRHRRWPSPGHRSDHRLSTPSSAHAASTSSSTTSAPQAWTSPTTPPHDSTQQPSPTSGSPPLSSARPAHGSSGSLSPRQLTSRHPVQGQCRDGNPGAKHAGATVPTEHAASEGPWHPAWSRSAVLRICASPSADPEAVIYASATHAALGSHDLCRSRKPRLGWITCWRLHWLARSCTSGRTGETAGSPLRNRQPAPSSTMPSRTHTSPSNSAHSPRQMRNRAFGRTGCADQTRVFRGCVTMAQTELPGRERDEHAMAREHNGGHRPAAGSRAERRRLRAGVRGPVRPALSASGHIRPGHPPGGGRCGPGRCAGDPLVARIGNVRWFRGPGEPPGSQTATIYTRAMPVGARTFTCWPACVARRRSRKPAGQTEASRYSSPARSAAEEEVPEALA